VDVAADERKSDEKLKTTGTSRQERLALRPLVANAKNCTREQGKRAVYVKLTDHAEFM
jgi:hypothetical protein